MGIPTHVYRALRYRGPDGTCVHDVLLRAGRPGWPNHDGGAEAAADALAEGTLVHQQAWFERWRLPSLCAAAHTCEHLGDEEGWEELDGDPAPFTWVPVERDGLPVLAYYVSESAADGDLAG